MKDYDKKVLEKALDLVIYRILSPLDNGKTQLAIYNAAFKGVKDFLIKEAVEDLQSRPKAGRG